MFLVGVFVPLAGGVTFWDALAGLGSESFAIALPGRPDAPAPRGALTLTAPLVAPSLAGAGVAFTGVASWSGLSSLTSITAFGSCRGIVRCKTSC